MSSKHQQFTPKRHFTAIVMFPAIIIYAILITLPHCTLAGSYAFKPNMLSLNVAQHQQQQYQQQNQPMSALASKVLFHSPSIANIYKEMIVSSKPLHLRKHGNGSKAKKTKKDSKIYYIPIPPMPYRYIPGVGLDYQPTKIKPILQETPLASGSMTGLNEIAHVSSGNGGAPTISSQQTTTLNRKSENNLAVFNNDMAAYGGANINEIQVNPYRPTVSVGGESKFHRMDRGDYFFNGRPFRLQVAHAQPKNQLTPLNLKSKLYFNKKIIY
ncbi:uncharacterized protein LOC101455096 [Ceratitis capitata]|uniref:uncharacterized protein LOC101455096 n=1 Tax=Ceratitis capitata TaxID=7213 RepID=UPI000329D6BF|nr:uncharacterized protein LOC101455096 [Ceratitis capitata]XP_020713727.1 uncharacterized protein LOC101455096 [Ceratitis capitata]XP_020713728.1 uncharacterized protein LOC101455096 [Ceratitis capitata]